MIGRHRVAGLAASLALIGDCLRELESDIGDSCNVSSIRGMRTSPPPYEVVWHSAMD